MKKTIFTGSGVALVTPFTDDGVNYDALGALIDDQINRKTDCIVICGTTGEASTMPDREHMDVIEYAVKHTAGRIPVVAGVGSNDTAHCIELCRHAEAVGADGLLVVTPYYNKTSQHGLLAHYSAICAKVSAPIILYNVPSRTGLNISLDTMKQLAKIDNIVAVKEASGNIDYVASIAASCPELAIYSGNDDMIVPVMSLGGKGVISVLANICPEETHNICAYYAAGEVEKARTLQLDMLDLIHKLFIEVNPVPVKTAMNLLGMNVGPLRLPLCDMAEGNLAQLKQAMANCGLAVQ